MASPIYKTIVCDVLPGSRPSASRFEPFTLEGVWKGCVTDIKVTTKARGSFVLHVGLLRQRIALSVDAAGESILHVAEEVWADVPLGEMYEVQHVVEDDDVEVLSLTFVVVLRRGDDVGAPSSRLSDLLGA